MTPFSAASDLRQRLNEGLAHHRAGRLDEAERAYRKVLDETPHHPEALHLLGVVVHQRGDSRAALPFFERAAGPLAGEPDFHANYGLALKDAGRWTRAKTELRRALARRSDHAGAMFNLGLLLEDEGDWDEAARLFARLSVLDPGSAETFYFLGLALAESGRAGEARRNFQKALDVDPDCAPARVRLAEMALDAGAPDEALAVAAGADPRDIEAAAIAIESLERRGDAAGRDARRGGAGGAGAAKLFCDLGCQLRGRGLTAGAARAFRRSLSFDPGHAQARWNLHRLLPPSYQAADEVEGARRRYEEGLGVIERGLRLDSPSEAGADFDALVEITNFYLAYQERDDRDLQRRFGALARRVVVARFPEFVRDPAMPEPEPDGRLRIGILSAYLRRHTVGRLFAGWFEKLDRRRFRVFGYHVGRHADAITRLIGGQCDTFREMPPGPAEKQDNPDGFGRWFEGVCRAVARDRLHALIFPEIGMDPATFCLAALRLAPVQAVSWGHPVTTGLPTVDYFLSSDLMEPADGDRHYSERLVRLPNISVRLFDQGAPRRERKPRAAFGLAPDEVVFLSSQSVYKYVPWYDRIFPAIAQQVPAARFVFPRSENPEMDRPFLVRLAGAFAAAGLDRDRHCRFLDRLSTSEFGDLNHAADVYLDTPGWSGGNTTHEAISAGLPIVTLPGRFMRGRHSYAMLKMIGVEDTIARDVDDYIAIAVRLGQDEGARRAVRARVEANRARLYNDDACVRGLEDFLVRAVAERAKKA